MTNTEKKSAEGFDYGLYWDSRKECVGKFGGIFDLPIIQDPNREMALAYGGGNILISGAGKDKPLKACFDPAKGTYYSLDNDPQGEFDFNGIDEIPADLKFDLILANQFFEHLTVNDSIEVMRNTAKHLNQGGKFILTVPNISHPNRHFSDIDHLTFWPYHSIYMLYKCADLDVTKICRYGKRHPQGFMEKLIIKYVSRVYRMDWCDSILLMGEKK